MVVPFKNTKCQLVNKQKVQCRIIENKFSSRSSRKDFKDEVAKSWLDCQAVVTKNLICRSILKLYVVFNFWA